MPCTKTRMHAHTHTRKLYAMHHFIIVCVCVCVCAGGGSSIIACSKHDPLSACISAESDWSLCQGDNLHEVSKPIFGKKKKKPSSEIFTQSAEC